jgi:hypothetical protein
MEFKLWDRPGWESAAIERIDVDVDRVSRTLLRFRYAAYGRIERLIVPERGAPVRQNNLWQTTCFEAFLMPEDGQDYLEFNFSPSTAWAAYHFSAHRAGMSQAALIAPPEIAVAQGQDHLQLDVAVSLHLPHDRYRMGLAAVIDEGGRNSYWALNHPGDAPDFHHRGCFSAELPPATRP